MKSPTQLIAATRRALDMRQLRAFWRGAMGGGKSEKQKYLHNLLLRSVRGDPRYHLYHTNLMNTPLRKHLLISSIQGDTYHWVYKLNLITINLIKTMQFSQNIQVVL